MCVNTGFLCACVEVRGQSLVSVLTFYVETGSLALDCMHQASWLWAPGGLPILFQSPRVTDTCCHAWFYMGFELRSLCLVSKCFTYWVISPVQD